MAHLLYSQKKYVNMYVKAGFVNLIADDFEQFSSLAFYVRDHAAAFWYIHALSQEGDKISRILCEQARINASPRMREVLRIVIDQLLMDRMIHIFPHVIQALVRVVDKQKRCVRAKIFISHILKDEHLQTCVNYFSWLMGKKVISDIIIDPALIAGMRFETANYLWEQSVRQQLRAISVDIYEDKI